MEVALRIAPFGVRVNPTVLDTESDSPFKPSLAPRRAVQSIPMETALSSHGTLAYPTEQARPERNGSF